MKGAPEKETSPYERLEAMRRMERCRECTYFNKARLECRRRVRNISSHRARVEGCYKFQRDLWGRSL